MKSYIGLFGLAFLVWASLGLAGCAATGGTPPAVATSSVAQVANSSPSAVPSRISSTGTIVLPTNTAVPPTVTRAATGTATSAPTGSPTVTALPTVPPTNTPIPPTPTLSPTAPRPTLTATLAHPTLSASSSTSAAARIQAALAKNHALKTYHGTIQYNIGDAQFLDWQGDVSEPNAHFKVVSDWYSVDSEGIAIGDQRYTRPYNDSTKSYDGNWDSSTKSASQLDLLQSPNRVLQNLIGNVAHYKKANTITLDGLSCDVYQDQDPSDALKTFVTTTTTMGTAFAMTAEQIGEVASATLALDICSDGYIHGAGLDIQPKPSTDANTPSLGEINLVALLSKPNQAVQITAP